LFVVSMRAPIAAIVLLLALRSFMLASVQPWDSCTQESKYCCSVRSNQALRLNGNRDSQFTITEIEWRLFECSMHVIRLH
jgi:hypothetical protein